MGSLFSIQFMGLWYNFKVEVKPNIYFEVIYCMSELSILTIVSHKHFEVNIEWEQVAAQGKMASPWDWRKRVDFPSWSTYTRLIRLPYLDQSAFIPRKIMSWFRLGLLWTAWLSGRAFISHPRGRWFWTPDHCNCVAVSLSKIVNPPTPPFPPLTVSVGEWNNCTLSTRVRKVLYE